MDLACDSILCTFSQMEFLLQITVKSNLGVREFKYCVNLDTLSVYTFRIDARKVGPTSRHRLGDSITGIT